MKSALLLTIGTLIVVVPARDGVVIVADSKLTRSTTAGVRTGIAGRINRMGEIAAPLVGRELFSVVMVTTSGGALTGACPGPLFALLGSGVGVRLGLLVIAAVYILRGLSAIPEALLLLRDAGAFPPRFLVFSLISMAIGLVHAAGTTQAWRRLRHYDRP